MIYTCSAKLAVDDLEVVAQVHDGHAYLQSVRWHGCDLLPGILKQPDLLADLEEYVWQRWFEDTR